MRKSYLFVISVLLCLAIAILRSPRTFRLMKRGNAMNPSLTGRNYRRYGIPSFHRRFQVDGR